MKGLELSYKYWEDIGRPAFERECPEMLEHCAVGLAGEGSECFGYDDSISRDHDWGPGFCIWLSPEAYAEYGAAAAGVYSSLPRSFMGFERLRESEMTAGRVGVMEIDSFFSRFIGKLPETPLEWLTIPESGLAAATNGKVFMDSEGSFSAVRDRLLAYYPEDVRLKKLAAQCALAAQAGQYNYYRCHGRMDRTAEFLAVSEFIRHAQYAVFLLNRRYMPYYKWTARAMEDLPLSGSSLCGTIKDLTASVNNAGRLIEQISAVIIARLKAEGLSSSGSDFLLDHAVEIQSRIADPQIASLHLMQE